MRSKSGQCSCCRLRDLPDFQEIVDLYELDVKIYRNCICHPCGIMAEPYMYILVFNNKDVEKEDMLQHLDKVKIICPQCQFIKNHVQKLVQELAVSSFKKNLLLSICELCDHSKHLRIPENNCLCKDILKKFSSTDDDIATATCSQKVIEPRKILELLNLQKEPPEYKQKIIKPQGFAQNQFDFKSIDERIRQEMIKKKLRMQAMLRKTQTSYKKDNSYKENVVKQHKQYSAATDRKTKGQGSKLTQQKTSADRKTNAKGRELKLTQQKPTSADRNNDVKRRESKLTQQKTTSVDRKTNAKGRDSKLTQQKPTSADRGNDDKGIESKLTQQKTTPGLNKMTKEQSSANQKDTESYDFDYCLDTIISNKNLISSTSVGDQTHIQGIYLVQGIKKPAVLKCLKGQNQASMANNHKIHCYRYVKGDSGMPENARFGQLSGPENFHKGSKILPNVKPVRTNMENLALLADKNQSNSTETNSRKPENAIFRYRLSDPVNIEKGLTILPTVKSVRKLNVYKMQPAQPQYDWFSRNRNKEGVLMFEGSTNEKFATFKPNGGGQLFYKNGNLALDYYDSKDINTNKRMEVYSKGDNDDHTVLAVFDHLGNGAVYDQNGGVRLRYNQTEGVVFDKKIGPFSHWKWHNLNEPPQMKQIFEETTDPQVFNFNLKKIRRQSVDEAISAIELENERKHNVNNKKYLVNYHIRPKTVKINENFSLRILDQATVYLHFREDSSRAKFNIGMLFDKIQIIAIDINDIYAETSLDRIPPRTESVEELQRKLGYPEPFPVGKNNSLDVPVCSVDKMTAPVSPPLRLPLINPYIQTLPTRCTCSSISLYRRHQQCVPTCSSFSK